MKALILNGSPREKGNTAYACEIITELLEAKYPGIRVETCRMQTLSVAPCRGCNACKKNGARCVITDDGTALVREASQADILVFASPVYQSGVSAQLKAALDRMYAIGGLTPVKIQHAYTVVCGADPLEAEHYDLIRRQFSLLCPYQGWVFSGYCAFCAEGADDLKKQEGVRARLARMLEGSEV